MNDVTISGEKLRELATNKLASAGFPMQDAEIISDILTYADERGVHSHGVMRVEHYCTRLYKGGMNANPVMAFEQKTPVISILDSDNGMGHLACKLATEHGVSVARTQGISMVVIKNTSHCGALAYYSEFAARNNIICIGMTQTDKCVVPFNGSEPFFGTNPITFSFPSKDGNPIVIDMATSNVAFGKILYAQEKKSVIPDDWAVDSDGNSITDPEKYAALLPFGGVKGYCIGLTIDALTGVLMNGQFGPHINKMYGDYDKMRGLTSTFIFINPDFFGGLESFKLLTKQMSDELHKSKPKTGVEKVLLPGEHEFNNSDKSRKNGITIPYSVYSYLTS